MAVYPLVGVVQEYAWGSRTALAELLRRAPSGSPEAEYWLGTHPQGMARLLDPTDEARDLRELVGGELPFLFKVLAAASPLSLQVHPSAQQALAGYEAENARGVPLDASFRNYRDKNHKPELICALSPFFALSGFRTSEESLALMRDLGMAGDFTEVCAPLIAGDLETYFRTLFAQPVEALGRAIERLAIRCAKPENLSGEAARIAPWIFDLARRHPKDPGVLAALLLNLIELAPGEAMYLPAGNLHAYLGGVGLEIMAASDNVLRGGLTNKHVDLEELMKVLRFEAYRPEVLLGEWREPSRGARVRTYRTPAHEFELSQIELVEGSKLEVVGQSLLLVLEGRLEADGVVFTPGAAAYVSDIAQLTGSARVASASRPGPRV